MRCAWLACLLLAAAAGAHAQAALDYGLRPREIAPGVLVIEGAVADFSRANGCNIINTGLIATREGTLGDQHRASRACTASSNAQPWPAPRRGRCSGC